MVPKQGNKKDVIELLNNIPGLNYGAQEIEGKHLDAIALLALPSHLRKTALAMLKVSKADVSCISEITGNEENIESAYLEELVDMRYLRKQITDLEICYELHINVSKKQSPNKLPP